LIVRTRLLAISVAILISLVVMGCLGIYGMREMKVALNRTYNADFVPMHLIAEANHALIILHREMLSHLLEDDISITGDYRNSILLQKNILQDKIQQLSEIDKLTEQEMDLIRNIDNDVKQILPLSEELIASRRSGSSEETKRRILTVVRPHLETIDANMNQFLEIQKSEAHKTIEFVNHRYWFYITLGSISLSVVIAAWILLCLGVIIKSNDKHKLLDVILDRWFHV
jgi:hypothetical protein